MQTRLWLFWPFESMLRHQKVNMLLLSYFSANHRFSLKIFKTLDGRNFLNFSRRRKCQTFLEFSDIQLWKKYLVGFWTCVYVMKVNVLTRCVPITHIYMSYTLILTFFTLEIFWKFSKNKSSLSAYASDRGGSKDSKNGFNFLLAQKLRELEHFEIFKILSKNFWLSLFKNPELSTLEGPWSYKIAWNGIILVLFCGQCSNLVIIWIPVPHL